MKNNIMKHIFIAGGLGMLQKVTEYYIESEFIVTTLARNQDKLQRLKTKYPEAEDRIFLLAQDYNETDKALEKVQRTVHQIGTLDLALLWIHKTGQSFREQLISCFLKNYKESVIYNLIGSSSVNPLELADTHLLQKYPAHYREIYLGYKRENKKVRWLHDQEISEGVIAAMNNDLQINIIGEINPWAKKPI
jgi:hypothetical protein